MPSFFCWIGFGCHYVLNQAQMRLNENDALLLSFEEVWILYDKDKKIPEKVC